MRKSLGIVGVLLLGTLAVTIVPVQAVPSFSGYVAADYSSRYQEQNPVTILKYREATLLGGGKYGEFLMSAAFH